MKKALFLLVFVALAAGGGYAYYRYSSKPAEPTVNTGIVSRGDVIDTVGSTGTLSAVSQVQVGAQVSGIIVALGADFNDLVKKGQVLARLDPTTIETQILQAKANLVRSQTDIERAKVSLADAQRKFNRAKELLARKLIPQTDFDETDLTLQSAISNLKSSEAALQQAEASLKQNEVNLEHTIILSPIDGLVISRAMDLGQTVSASMSAPTLFTIAADLTKMKVIAGVDESDVGRIRPDQRVRFRVDAYPTDTFFGTVEQVRLEPKLQQNVVTYSTVISAPNPELKLKPGMTANLNIEISRAENVLRVPNAALRFRPTNEMYTALGLQPPPDAGRGGRGGLNRGGGSGTNSTRRGTPGTEARTTPPLGGATAAAPPRSGGGEWPTDENGGSRSAGAGQRRNGETRTRMQNMTPEERTRLRAARGDNRTETGRGGAGGPNGRVGTGRASGSGSQGRGGRQNAPTTAELNAPGGATTGATTIDRLFPALAKVETRGRAWTWDKAKKELTSHNLRLGISDGQTTQLLESDFTEGTEVITNIITAASVRPGFNPQQGNPFFQGPGGRGQGGGNRGFGGGRGF